MSARTLLVLGGARAGKSAYAVERAGAVAGRVAFVATAEALDAEMAARIARHRAARPAGWETVETPLALVDVLAGLEGKAGAVVVDCLTLWVSNLLRRDPALSDGVLRDETDRLAEIVARRPFHLVIVSNEVGWGVHPETALGRRFRDALGLVNHAVAAAADEVVLLIAGCPLWLKVP
ncbi:MAG: bifunctional adenosylcobinamide kinase/adenosylcobinamide-phosphate guanylyltransferase [Candidatus Rokubacteria bacterium]|nr:bifunctional adenosylcobinamide kinase/adenosylcobinamide-phosphate guanylyltransferase [Candidatus Rokubacteria bacterium]